ncbi:CRISPR-associated endonuclease Cas1 [Nitrosomonas ureae]|uniref:CRISPR-associated endonuclease Cas1 n=1 Tax=Nitrosomonas ureae TaxID=44577 RepID=UPI000BE3C242|nr:CRISPR-associated endonuclease Cas1 [Nitrosomonas ureae]
MVIKLNFIQFFFVAIRAPTEDIFQKSLNNAKITLWNSNILIVFFHCGYGTIHTDQDGRASLVYDLMEPLRPLVDKIIFAWVTLQRWRRADFAIDLQGVIRVHPQLARLVVTKALLPDKIIREEINAYVNLLKQFSNNKSAVTR